MAYHQHPQRRLGYLRGLHGHRTYQRLVIPTALAVPHDLGDASGFVTMIMGHVRLPIAPAFLLAFCLSSAGAEPDSKAEQVDKATLKRLVEKAKDWKVPEPQPNSSLLKIWAFRRGGGPDAKDFYTLGFVEPNKTDEVLIGMHRLKLRPGEETIAIKNPANFPLADVSASSPFGDMYPANNGLIAAVQLANLGHEDMAVKLANLASTTESGHHRSTFRSRGGENPELMLARACLASAMNDITSADPDFTEIRNRIERLCNDHHELVSKATEYTLKSLEDSATYKPAPEGTLARLVDDFLASGGSDGGLNSKNDDFHPAERKLILKGFEAIPTLLKARESKRLTNHQMVGFNNFVGYPMTANQVIDSYLQRLANDDLGSNWLDRQKGWTPEDDAVLAWWDHAQQLGEEGYVRKHAVAKNSQEKTQVSHALLLIAAERYPRLLFELYAKLLKSDHYSWPAGTLLAQAESIPVEERILALRQGVRTNSQLHRNSALAQIRKLDANLADTLLIDLIKKAPRSPKKEYWIDMDAGLGGHVCNSTNVEVWKTLDTLIKKADLGMRMQLIDGLAPKRNPNKDTHRFYEDILSRYENDTTVRDESKDKRFSGPGAGFPHDILTMRDYIFTRWKRWLALDVKEPDRYASKQEWKTFREAVKKEVTLHRQRQQATQGPSLETLPPPADTP